MSGKSEKEKLKKEQERYQVILARLLREEDNKYCADCDGKGPRWASWNIGIFLCIRCAGIHRNLGVHISRVKSVNLDSWTAEQIESMETMGNLKARQIYEFLLPESHRRPQSDSSLEHFIRAKYEKKQWIDKNYMFPSKDREVEQKHKDDKKGKKKFDRKSMPIVTSSDEVHLKEIKYQESTENHFVPPSISKINTPTTLVETSSNDVGQLLFCSNDMSQFEVNSTKESLKVFGKEDSFPCGSELIGLDVSVELSSSKEENLLGEDLTSNNTSSKRKPSMTKDSIMALYGSNNQNQTVYGVPGGHYMTQQYQQTQHVQHFGIQQKPFIHDVPKPSMQSSYNNIPHSTPNNYIGRVNQQPQHNQYFQQIRHQVYPTRPEDATAKYNELNPSNETVANNTGWTSIPSTGQTLSTQLWK